MNANYRLVVRPVVNDENEPDFRKVEIVCVESVEDYHGREKNNTIVSWIDYTSWGKPGGDNWNERYVSKELTARTGVTDKHINTVIKGKKNISDF